LLLVASFVAIGGCGRSQVEPLAEALAPRDEAETGGTAADENQMVPTSLSLPASRGTSPLDDSDWVDQHRERKIQAAAHRAPAAESSVPGTEVQVSNGAKTKDLASAEKTQTPADEAPAVTEVSRAPVEKLYPNRKPKSRGETITLSDGVTQRDGPWVSFYPDGQKYEEGAFTRDKRTGRWNYYHENGSLAKSGEYVDGQPDGTWQYRRTDGSLEHEECYRSGKRHGAWRYFDRMERPLKLETFENGSRQGETVTWFVSGQKATEENYVANELNGVSRTWHENGMQATEQTYERGKLQGRSTSWSPEGEVLVELLYEKGRVLGRPARHPGP